MAPFSLTLALLLALAVQHSSALFGRSAPAAAADIITQEVDLIGSDGRRIHDILSYDRACRHENDTIIYSDGSVSIDYTDHQTGMSLLLLSGEPDVCYIRDTSQEPQSCLVNRVTGKNDVSDAVTPYEEGETVNLEELPAAIRAQCLNRKVVILRQVESKEEVLEDDEADLQAGQEDGAGLPPKARGCIQIKVKVKVEFGCKCSKRVWGVCVRFSCKFRFEWRWQTKC